MSIKTLIPGTKELVTFNGSAGDEYANAPIPLPDGVVLTIDNEAVATVEKVTESTAWVHGLTVGDAILTATLGDKVSTFPIHVVEPELLEIIANSDVVVAE